MLMVSQVQPPLKAKDARKEKGYNRYKYGVVYGLNQSPKNMRNTLEESNLQLIFFYSKICYPKGRKVRREIKSATKEIDCIMSTIKQKWPIKA
jgi:hypothetical protein